MGAFRLVSVLAAASACTSIGFTCCVTYGEHSEVALVGERAIILWDAEQGREHFVRQASFNGEAKDFGFIVPAPTKPEVAEADVKAFSLLEGLVPGEPTRGTKGLAAGAASDDAGSANLIEQYKVGDYEVSILKASEGTAMLAWLKANGYTNRPAMEPWLDHYAKMGWYFAALKFTRAKDSVSPETRALRVSFDANEPFYPYKMPSDTWPTGHYRPMALYFVSYGTARASYRGENKAWEAEIRWSGPLPMDTAKRLAQALNMDLTDIPAAATVTVFNNTKNAQGYDRDLRFLTYTSVLPTWVLFIAGGAGLVGLVYAFTTRKKPLAS